MNKRAQQLLVTAVHENGFFVALELLLQVHLYLCFCFLKLTDRKTYLLRNLSRSPPHWLHTQINAQEIVFYQFCFIGKIIFTSVSSDLLVLLRPDHMQIIELHFSLDNHTIKGIWQQIFLSFYMKEHLKLCNNLFYTHFVFYFVLEIFHFKVCSCPPSWICILC